jgi:peptidoglycan DL-endopeptidase CwlO
MESNTQIRSFLSFFLFTLLSTTFAFGQSKKIDRLEQYYDQGHYKMVYRKSSKLLLNPQFDSSTLPMYYKAMSSFKLMQNQAWLRRNHTNMHGNIELMNKVIDSDQWPLIMNSHSNELSDIEVLFDVWLAQGANAVGEEEKSYIDNWIITVFRQFKIEVSKDEFRDEEGLIPEGLSVDQRTSMIHYAYEYMGIPYKWGGTDENGFDCSGYTKHVFMYKGIELPRVSKDQYNYSKKINKKRAYMGDLVFFSEGEGITHVGILVNNLGESKKMIHSSSSKGISVVDIDASEYWRKRLFGFGRILK